jgi:indolepyruvate ferredoxin oxidoreductase beta subunit
MESYMRIVGEVVEPALSGDLAAGRAGDALANARAAALADPTGRRLAEVIEAIAGAPVPRAAE